MFRKFLFQSVALLAALAFATAACNRSPSSQSNHTPTTDGWKIYTANCVVCHHPDGKGLPGAFPPLAGSEWVIGSDRRLIALTLDGVMDTQTVEGRQYHGVMPAWRKPLNDAQLAAVLTCIRQTWGNSSPPVSPLDVQQVRAATLNHKTFWSAKELLGFNPSTPAQ